MSEIKRAGRLSHALVLLVTHRTFFNVHEMSGPPIRAKYKHFKTLCAYIGSFSHWFKVLFLEVLIIQARVWNFVQLLSFCLPIHNTSRRMLWACHSILQDNATVFAWGFHHPDNFSVAPAEIRDSNISLFSVYIHAECIPSIHDQEMNLAHQDQPVASISSTWESYSASFQSIYNRPRIPIRIILLFDEQIDLHNSVLLPIQVPTELPRTVFPTRSLRVTMISAIYVVEDVSRYPDTLTLESWVMQERLPFLLECKLKLRRLLVMHKSSLAITSITFAAVICEADEPCSVNTATTRPLYFGNFGSNSTFFKITNVHQCTKVDFPLVSLRFQNNPLSTSDFSNCHSGLPQASSIPCPLLLLHPKFSSLAA